MKFSLFTSVVTILASDIVTLSYGATHTASGSEQRKFMSDWKPYFEPTTGATQPLMMQLGSKAKKTAFWDKEREEGKFGAKASAGSVTCTDGFVGTLPCQGVDQLAFLSLADIDCSATNDIWGWTDPQTGKEYVLAGCTTGTAMIDISNPTIPVPLGLLPSTNSVSSNWRDIKVYNNHAYIGSEAANHGIQVFDLTQLRDAPPGKTNRFSVTTLYSDVGSTHNVIINEASGVLYAVGASEYSFQSSSTEFHCNGGLHMVDITSSTNPTFLGCFSSDGYTHDAQCVIYNGPDTAYVGNEICFAYNEDSITVVDVTNKQSPVQLSRTTYANSRYTHQGWLDSTQTYVMMDDELDEGAVYTTTTTHIFNFASLTNPIGKTGSFTSPVKAIDHNLYIKNGKAYQSNYCAGLRILDTSTLSQGTASEIGYFQVRENCDSPEFEGSWSNYPFFDSNVIAISDIENGVYVLREQNLPSPAPSPAPTGPSYAPTVAPTALPTPTPMPTEFDPLPPLFPPYQASGEGSVDREIEICGSPTVTFSLCPTDGGSNNGDTTLAIHSKSDNALVASNDDFCGFASKISHQFSHGSGCKRYYVRQSCFALNSCGGQVATSVSGTPPSPVPNPVPSPTDAPIQSAPTTSAPTASPTRLPTRAPTAQPTLAPVEVTLSPTVGNAIPDTYAHVYMAVPNCEPFSLSNTADATTNTQACNFAVCPGTMLNFYTCHADGKSCDGDTMLRLKDSNGVELFMNDDRCGLCSSIKYQFGGDKCETYTIIQGCFGDTSCSGTTYIEKVLPGVGPGRSLSSEAFDYGAEVESHRKKKLQADIAHITPVVKAA